VGSGGCLYILVAHVVNTLYHVATLLIKVHYLQYPTVSTEFLWMREYSGALFHVILEATMHCIALIHFKALPLQEIQDSLPPDYIYL
jgi:hypothetical protein